MRLVYVSDGPLPYHTPILNALRERLDLHVIYMAEGHPLGDFVDLWGAEPQYPYEMYWSFPIRFRRLDFRAQVSVGVGRRIRRSAPDAVLVSSWGPLTWEPLVWSKCSRTASVMWAESTATSGLFRGPVSNSVRRRVVSLADTVVTESSSATSFVHELGAAES